MKKAVFIFPVLSFFLSLATLWAQSSIIDEVQKFQPALVTVKAETLANYYNPNQADVAFNKQTGRLIVHRNIKTAIATKSGAGIVISPSGIIITNAHTIEKANSVTIIFSDGKELPAQLLRLFPHEDLVFLKLNAPAPTALPFITFADSDSVVLGDEIIHIGHSKLLRQTISGGKIVGIGSRRTEKRLGNDDTDLFQVNINLYKGDSGGPLLNKNGQLIGLVVAGQRRRDRSSFAIPSNKIKNFYKICLQQKTQK